MKSFVNVMDFYLLLGVNNEIMVEIRRLLIAFCVEFDGYLYYSVANEMMFVFITFVTCLMNRNRL